MEDHEAKVFQCSGPEDFILAQHAIIVTLPHEMRDRLSEICVSYLRRYGVEGCYERMNNRSLSQIFAEYQPDDAKPIAEGEVDGIRYQLFEGPPDE